MDIIDNGIGMSKSTRSKIFDKFYRPQTGDLHNVKGHGLGLSYVKKIIDLHKGSINVVSVLGKGSSVIAVTPSSLRRPRTVPTNSVPVITFVDTAGAYPGVEGEERCQSEAIARNLATMSELKTPIIVVVTGEGGSGGALAISVGDHLSMLEYAIYSVASPEACASIIWRSSEKAPDAAEAMKVSSNELKKIKIVDEIIQEPLGGAHRDYDLISENIKGSLIRNL